MLKKAIIILTLTLIMASMVFAENETISNPPKSYWYIAEDPVCGSDGVTYQNQWFAQIEGVDYTTGACQQGIDNTMWYAIGGILLVAWYLNKK